MPLSLIPPRAGYSPNWRIRGTVRGRYINETTGTTDKAQADAIRIKREAALLDESVHGARVGARFSAAAVEYAEKKAPGRSQLDAIIGYPRKDGTLSPCLVSDFGLFLCSAIDQAAVDRVIRTRFKGRSPATVQRNFLTPLVAVLNFAAQRKWCDAPRFERPKTERGRTRWATYEEADRLLAAAPPHLHRILLFLLLTGARLGEVLGIEWQDVDLAGRWAVLRDTKRGSRGHDRGEDRGIPLHPQLVLMLANLPRPKGGGPVFLSSLGQPYAERDGGGHLKTAWAATLKRAGIEDLRVHDLRHTFATWLLMAGAQDEVREKIMGHSSSRMSRRYAHVPDDSLVAAVSLLGTRAKSVQQAYPYPGRSKQNQEVA